MRILRPALALLTCLVLPQLAAGETLRRASLPEGITPSALAPTPTTLFFRGAHTGEADRLWQLAGDAATPVTTAAGDALEDPRAVALVNDWLYVTTAGGVLQRTNGSAVVRVADGPVLRAFPATGRVYFTVAEDDDEALWVTDADGTRAVGARLPFGAAATAFGPRLLFAGSSLHGSEPWLSDGTEAGTRELADLVPGPAGSGPRELAAVRDTATFFTHEGLWRTDGTTLTHVEAFAAPAEARGLGARLYFAAEDGTWSSDGTATGTHRLAERAPDVSPAFVAAGAHVFFVGGYGNASALYATDGTAATPLVYGTASALTPVGNHVYFPLDATRLGRSDGTRAGSQVVPTELPEGVLDPTSFASAGNQLYFTSTSGDRTALWIFEADPEPVTAAAPAVAPAADDSQYHARGGSGCGCSHDKSAAPLAGLLFLGVLLRRPRQRP